MSKVLLDRYVLQLHVYYLLGLCDVNIVVFLYWDVVYYVLDLEIVCAGLLNWNLHLLRNVVCVFLLVWNVLDSSLWGWRLWSWLGYSLSS